MITLNSCFILPEFKMAERRSIELLTGDLGCITDDERYDIGSQIARIEAIQTKDGEVVPETITGQLQQPDGWHVEVDEGYDQHFLAVMASTMFAGCKTMEVSEECGDLKCGDRPWQIEGLDDADVFLSTGSIEQLGYAMSSIFGLDWLALSTYDAGVRRYVRTVGVELAQPSPGVRAYGHSITTLHSRPTGPKLNFRNRFEATSKR